MGNEIKQQEQIKLPQDFQALIAGFFPNTKYFDSRFDLLQVQIDELRRNQGQIKEQVKDFKDDTDKRTMWINALSRWITGFSGLKTK